MALSPIRVAPGGRYFETFDNEPLLFLGANDAVDWPGLFGLYERCDVATAEAYLQSLADNGVTILRLMLDYGQNGHTYFESPFGHFAPVMVQLWDDLLARCEALGLRVLLAPYDTFWFDRRWDANPYNAANGGPLARWQGWLDSELAIEAMIHRFRFVIERWGGSGVIAAWDLFNEIGAMWGGGTVADNLDLFARVSDAIRETELRVGGFTRPQTISRFGPDPLADGYDALCFRAPYLDFATTHVYQRHTIDAPQETVRPARDMGRWVRYALAHIPSGRPYTDSEHGPIHLHNDHGDFLPEPFDDKYERHLMWAHLASGGAGSGMRWPARHPHLITTGMKRALGCVSNFARLVDWRHFSPRDACDEITVGVPRDDINVFACRDNRQAVAWLLRGPGHAGHEGMLPATRPPLRDVPFTLTGLEPGDYDVRLFVTVPDADPNAGAPNQIVRVGADRVLRLALPTLANDLALAVRPAPRRTL